MVETLILSALLIAAGLLTLFFGSIEDLKKREVGDWIWLAGSAFGLILNFTGFITNQVMWGLKHYMLVFLVTSLMGTAIFYLGFFGGADAKALITLSLQLPYPPFSFLEMRSSLFFPLSVFIDSLLASLVIPVYIFTLNISRILRGEDIFEGQSLSKAKKLALIFIGYKLNASKLKAKKHVLPLETFEVTDEGVVKRKIKLLTRLNSGGRNELLSKLTLNNHLKKEIWVTPGLPFIFFMLIGLVLALIIGDPFSTLLLSRIR